MTHVMAHRGPDEAGHLLGHGVALGVRRLSIIDLASSHQPLSNEDGRIWTVFNGEIFNFRELRTRLRKRGHRLATDGDTEVLVHLYEEYGADFVQHLRGMFGIALWDRQERRLILARDRLGVKPLYYAVLPEGLAFASEIKCLLAGGLVTAALDHEAAQSMLALGYVPGDQTVFAGVRKLPPATTLQWHDGRLVGPEAYWSPRDENVARSGSWQEDEERLLDLLRSAVKMRMVSDVPLGVMLSGGLDSSLVASLMAEQSSGPISTFSIGFVEDSDSNELGWARKTADRLGSRHYELLTSASEHAGLLDDALWHLEEPVGDLSFLGFLLLSRLARETVTVALCGQAADELLGGYPKHRAARLADLVGRGPAALRYGVGALAGRFHERSRTHRLGRALAADDDYERLLVMSRLLPPGLLNALAGPSLGTEGSSQILAAMMARASPWSNSGSRLQRTLMLDLRTALPDLMFLYFDKMSMAASLEVRVPFADHQLVAFCMALPDDRRMRRLRGKEILRRVSANLVDESIISRPKRGFFRAASSSWLNQHGDMVRETLLDRNCSDRGLFDQTTLRRWLDQPTGSGRDGEPLLVAFLLERWHQLFVDPEGLASRSVGAAQRLGPPKLLHSL